MSNDLKEHVQDKFDTRVLIPVLIVGITEFELFTVSKGVVEIAKQDAWLSILIGSIIISINTYFLINLASRFPRENLFQYSKKILGKPFSLLIACGYFIFWALWLILLWEDIRIANKLLFLEETPSFVPLLILVIGAIWLVSYGLAAVVRFFQLLLPFLFLPLLIIALLSIRTIQLESFFPVLSNGLLPVVQGAFYYIGVLQGLEVILFLFPFLASSKYALKSALIGINAVNLFVFIFTFASIGIMGVENIRFSIWPIINLVSLIEIPGFPVERFELFLTLPWLLGVFTTACRLALYLFSYGFSQIFNFKSKKAIIYILAGITLLPVYFVPNYAWAILGRQFLMLLTAIFIFLIPIFILLVVNFQVRRNN